MAKRIQYPVVPHTMGQKRMQSGAKPHVPLSGRKTYITLKSIKFL